MNHLGLDIAVTLLLLAKNTNLNTAHLTLPAICSVFLPWFIFRTDHWSPLTLPIIASEHLAAPMNLTVTVMSVTSLCWWLYDGDWFEMLVAEWLCWRLFRYVSDFLNVLNRSPTSQTCHQHIWSPTSVTNIDVTESNCTCY